MAMSKSDLQQRLSQHPQGSTFTLSAADLGIPIATELFDTYLPGSTLTVEHASTDATNLTVSGTTNIVGQGEHQQVSVLFHTAESVVTVVTIKIWLTGWSFHTTGTTPLTFSAAFLSNLGFTTPFLELSADSTKNGYYLYLQGQHSLNVPGLPRQHSLLCDVPVDPNDNQLWEVEFGDHGIPLGDLDHLVPSFGSLGISTFMNGLSGMSVPLASNLGLRRLGLLINPNWEKVIALSLDVHSTHNWALAHGKFSLSELDLAFMVTYPASHPRVSCTITAQLQVGGITLDTVISLPDFNLEAKLPSTQTPSLADVLTHTWPGSGLTPGQLTVDLLDLAVDLKEGGYIFKIRVVEDLPLVPDLTLTRVTLSAWGNGLSTPQGEITALFELGEVAFVVSVKRQNSTWHLVGSLLGSVAIGDWLAALMTKFGGTLELPSPLAHLSFDDIGISWDSGSHTFVFHCASTGHGNIVFVASKPVSQWELGFYVELDLGATVSFPHIPLVGSKISPLGLESLALRVLSDPPPPASALTGQHHDFGSPPFRAGVAVSAGLEVGSQHLHKSAQLTGSSTGGSSFAADPPMAPAEAGQLTAVQPTRTDQVAWLKIDQEFGPVHLRKIGLGFDDSGDVEIIPDVGVKLSILDVELDGLKVSFPLAHPDQIHLALDSLEASYKSPELTIEGGFRHRSTTGGDIYEGEALIQAMEYQLAAVGAFFHRNHGPPSLFLYLDFDGELGGPPFFFVTGLAGGFGYNYSLKIPGIDGVRSFPFVDLAMGNSGALGGATDPEQILNHLDSVVQPQVGEDWLAAGLRFSTFEMLDSFALLTVQFGTHFEIALLGLSTLQVPIGDSNPIAQAQLALEVDFSPSSGLLKVEGRLTPASFILSHDCKLTGGFAFYTWFAGPHAGDFVITLGGYHPAFSKPAHYPNEPRVGYRWQIGPLHLDGGIYFALTPAALMAGARLDASFWSGGLHAWFNEHADFLLQWKPFHYDAELGFEIGVSYTIHVWFVHITISVHLGVDVHLWGPPFGGVAKFHVGPFHVSIYFGDTSPPARLPIPWSEFASSFLPSSSIVRTAISRGTVKGPQASYSGSIIKAAELQLELETVIPIKTGSFNGTAFTAGNFHDKHFAAPGSSPWNTSFGVGPCALPDSSLGSACTITLGHSNDPGGAKTNVALDLVHLRPTAAGSPASLWGAYRDLGDSSWLDDSQLVSDTLTRFTLVPASQPIGHTLGPFPVVELLYSYDPATDERHFHWSTASRPTSDTFDQGQAISQLEQTLRAPSVVQTRDALLTALHAQGLSIDTQPDVSHMAAHANDVLLASPALSLLGEE